MTSYSHTDRVELAREALIEHELVMGPVVSQLCALFPGRTLRGAISLIEEALNCRLGTVMKLTASQEHNLTALYKRPRTRETEP